jgi:hypothetical protein
MDSQGEQMEPMEAFEHEQADLYRARWLMAHNRLLDLVNGDAQEPQEVWRAYLDELIDAEKTARKAA